MASLVPGAAVIQAPMAYVKVLAFEKLVVGFLIGTVGPPLQVEWPLASFSKTVSAL